MKVKDLMTRKVPSCYPETELETAAKLMWDYDCGTLPVVNAENKIIGIITDLDIAVALLQNGGLLWTMPSAK